MDEHSQSGLLDDPFEDHPDKYAKYNYNVGQAHALILGEIMHNLQRLHTRINEHEKAHAAASRAALASADMPPTAKPTEGMN